LRRATIAALSPGKTQENRAAAMDLRRRSAFTLIELLIVVVILAILAAAVIPQFNDSTADAKSSTARINLGVLRKQIQLYKTQHDGRVPSADLNELTKGTDVTGAAGTDFGPYILRIPENPLTGSNKVRAATANPPAAASGASDAGWLYHAATGNIWIDDSGYLAE
jgi:prepilin-type N-terminal cleavage/methylation domain-containing protein